jgi:uncharacterized protein DUF4412
MKRMSLVLCLVALVSTQLSAELKYTLHMELKKSDAAPAQAANPVLSMMGDAVMRQMVPDGAADIVYLIGDKGARIEFMHAAMGQAAGAINLARPDGTLIVLNPKEKTYWKASVEASMTAMQAAGISPPEVSAKRTGQFETIAGAKCEVITFDWKMKIPVPEAARASLPPDFPTVMTMNGDSCATTDQYQKYGEIVTRSMGAMMAAMGFDKIAQGGLVLRQNMRMMGSEMRSAVTQIAEEAAPETAFEIPADYKEVPIPTGMGRR